MKKKELITTIIVIVIVGFTIIGKLFQIPQVVEQMRQLELENKLYLLAFIEVVGLTLYVIPKTCKVGFLLLTAYFGGAIAVNIKIPGNTLPAILILVIIWVMSYIKNPKIFTTDNNQN